MYLFKVSLVPDTIAVQRRPMLHFTGAAEIRCLPREDVKSSPYVTYMVIEHLFGLAF